MKLGRLHNAITISLFLLSCLIYVPFSLYFSEKQVESSREKYIFFLKAIGRGNNNPLANEIFENRFQALSMRLDSIADNQNLVYTAVYDSDNQLIAFSGDSKAAPPPLENPRPAESVIMRNKASLTVYVPITAYGEIFGYSLFHYSLDDLVRDARSSLAGFIGGLFLLMLIMLVLLNLVIKKTTIDPMNRMVAVFREIQQGETGKRIAVRGSDEIRELSRAFNTMSEKVFEGYRRLEKSEIFTQQVINTLESLLISCDSTGRVSLINEAASRYFRLTAEIDTGGDLYTLIPDLIPYKETLLRCLATGEMTFLHREQMGERFFNIHLYPLTLTDGLGVLIRMDDITLLEEKENRIRQFQKMDAIGQLAGGVAHDFNNMLAGSLSSAQVLQSPKRNLDERGRELVDVILQAAHRAADLTSKLLAFGRKTGGITTPCDMHTIIEETVSLLEKTIDKSISVSVIPGALHPVVKGDASALQNALLNICINASQAMPDGGDIVIETCNLPLGPAYCETSAFSLTPGEYIEISLRDTGSGIPPENLNKIFEPFFTTKLDNKGTGLGLASVFGIVQDHRGAISAYSEVGEGTVFHILLPLSTETYEPVSMERLELSGTGRILLVDDEDFIRKSGRALLEDMNFEVVVAEDGLEAVTLFAEQHESIDLVLMDMIMPRLNGTEAYHRMRAIDPHCKVVISSGFTKNENLNSLLEEGLSGFIQKPFQASDLYRILSEILSK